MKKPTKEQIKKIVKVIRAFDSFREKLRMDPRSSADYWNADAWGGLSGFREAAEWEENELAIFLLKKLE